MKIGATRNPIGSCIVALAVIAVARVGAAVRAEHPRIVERVGRVEEVARVELVAGGADRAHAASTACRSR